MKEEISLAKLFYVISAGLITLFFLVELGFWVAILVLGLFFLIAAGAAFTTENNW